MEPIASSLRRTGDFYEMDGETIRRVVGRPRTERNPFGLLWELREGARELLGGELPDDPFLMYPFGDLLAKLVRAEVRYVQGAAVLLRAGIGS